MSEIDSLQDQVAELNKHIMEMKVSLGELLSKAHAPEDCKLNDRIAILEKQQNRWAGGLVALIALASVIGGGISLVINKLWR